MFSRTRPTGSARVLGMGGTNVSLGGDFSSAYSNPAGLGMYNRSEFSFTPGYYSLRNAGSYMANDNVISDNNIDTKTSLNISGLGLMFSKPQNDQGFLHGTFGITVTRLNDFNSNLQYKGVNNSSSLIDYFIENANGGTPEQFGSEGALYNTVTGLGYDNYLLGEASILDSSFPSDQYFTDFDPAVNPNVVQQERIQTKGAQNQWNFSYGANFNDKFFLGGGVGVVALNFQSHKVFSESFTDQPISGYTLTEDLQIKGTGINLTIGGIARPADGFQVGASITTPTRYNLTDTYSAKLSSSWKNFDYYGDGSEMLNAVSSETDVITSGYTLRTPWKFAAGASYIFGKSGLITLDIENLNYGGAKYSSQTTGVSYDADNDDIKNLYASTWNFRAGGEFRLDALRFRAGAGYRPDPFKQQNDVSAAIVSGSLGAGYRANKFFIDVAYVKSWASASYRPYTLTNSNMAQFSPALNYDQNMDNIVATIGFTF